MAVNKNIIFCDTNLHDGNINLNSLKKILKKKNIFTIVVPHMYGNPAPIEKITKLCLRKKIFLIEDCAQSLGSIYKKKPLGSFGDAAIFSFGYSKNIDVGEGGCVALNDKKKANNIRNLYKNLVNINNSKKNKLKKIYRREYLNRLKNLNSQSFIKNKNFKNFEKLFICQNKTNWLKKANSEILDFEKSKKIRKKNFLFYQRIFQKHFSFIKINNNTNPCRFNLLIDKKIRNKFVNKLWNEGIHANIMYPSISNFLYGKKINSKNSFTLEKKIINFPLDKNIMTKNYKNFFRSKISKIINFQNNFK